MLFSKVPVTLLAWLSRWQGIQVPYSGCCCHVLKAQRWLCESGHIVPIDSFEIWRHGELGNDVTL
jgi:hypothetical protein